MRRRKWRSVVVLWFQAWSFKGNLMGAVAGSQRCSNPTHLGQSAGHPTI